MTSSEAGTIALHADREHTGVGVAVLLILAVVFVAGFLILIRILGGVEGAFADYAYALACVLALVLALAAAALAESLMKRHWPSGRRVEIDDHGLRAWLPGDETAALEWSGRVWPLLWTFSLAGYPRGGRERRLTKQHHCLACQLQQDDVRVIVYAYMAGREAQKMLEAADFRPIDPGPYYKRSPFRPGRRASRRPQLPSSLLAGKDGPHWMAEQRRWATGLELTGADFAVFWNTVKEWVEE